MYVLKQNTAITVPIFCHDADGDAVTGLVNAGFTKRISKNGGAFAAMTVTITEMENGWYSCPVSATHSNTLGILTVLLTHASCKQVNLQFRVSARIMDNLAWPTVAGRSVDVLGTGEVGIDLDNTQGTFVMGTEITGMESYTSARAAYLDWLAPTEVPANVSATLIDTNEIQGKMPTRDYLAGTSNASGVLEANGFTGNFAGSVNAIVTSVTVGTNNDKTGYTASTISDKTGYTIAGTKKSLDAMNDIPATSAGLGTWLYVLENSKTAAAMFRIGYAALANKVTGGGSNTNIFRDDADSKARITATVTSAGNRTTVVKDGA